jgi:ECF sigma factor
MVVFFRDTETNDVTRILSRIESGVPSAIEQLRPRVYELRRLAAQRLASEKPGQTYQPRIPTKSYSFVILEEQGASTNFAVVDI